MTVNAVIEKQRETFKSHLDSEELEYWGPVTPNLSDAFLQLSEKFLNGYFSNRPIILKSIFTGLVELVQNISEYNIKYQENGVADSYILLRKMQESVLIKTANLVYLPDLKEIKNRLEDLFSCDYEELVDRKKIALIERKSLGLIMLRMMSQAKFDWGIVNKGEQNWLVFELRISL